jgi:hypothetical protein
VRIKKSRLDVTCLSNLQSFVDDGLRSLRALLSNYRWAGSFGRVAVLFKNTAVQVAKGKNIEKAAEYFCRSSHTQHRF